MGYVEGTHIDLGSALVTFVEPTRDPHDLAEYNRWYEHDHAYSGVMAGPGAFSFGRFVKQYPHLKDRVTDVLIGDVFDDKVDVLWPLMDAMQSTR